MNKAAHSGFEIKRRRHQKSETGVSVAPKMDMCPPKIFFINFGFAEMMNRNVTQSGYEFLLSKRFDAWRARRFFQRFVEIRCNCELIIVQQLPFYNAFRTDLWNICQKYVNPNFTCRLLRIERLF